MNKLVNENKLMTFENKNFGTIRTIVKNGNPMFCLSDVCKALDLEQVSRVKSRLKEDGVTTSKVIDRLGREQEATFISESNLYKTIFQSRKESAEKFTDWVTSEVLPSIRKNGGYLVNQENLTPEQIVANALIVAQNIISQKDKLITEMKPKVEFYDDVTGSDDTIGMGEVAKILNLGIGRNKIFEILRNNNILQMNNTPYQKYVDLGYFRIVESKYSLPSGDIKINLKTVVFQKGLDFLRKTLKRYTA